MYVEEIGRKNERNNESILRKFLKDQMFVVTYPSHQRQVYLPHDVTKLCAQWDLPWLKLYLAYESLLQNENDIYLFQFLFTKK